MSKANFASTMTYVEEEKGKSKFPPKTEISISGIDRASLKEKIKENPEGVLIIPAADGGKTIEKQEDREEK